MTYPQIITPAIQSVCNLKCPTCRVTQSSRPQWFMGMRQFRKLTKRLGFLLKMAKSIDFSSSEPLFHPDIFSMIDRVKEYNPNIYCAIVTNGMLLDEDKTLRLLRRNVRNICVSLDGCTKETHEKIRVGSDFERIISNIQNFISMGGNVRTIFVARKDNIHELMGLVDLVAKLGIWKVKISGLNTYKPGHVDKCLFSYEGLPEIDALFLRAQESAKSKGIQLAIKPTKLENSVCSTLESMYIDINGDVSPCVFYSEPSPLSLLDKTRMTEVMSWGNVYKEDPFKIWCSDECRKFKRGLVDCTVCELCGMRYGVVC